MWGPPRPVSCARHNNHRSTPPRHRKRVPAKLLRIATFSCAPQCTPHLAPRDSRFTNMAGGAGGYLRADQHWLTRRSPALHPSHPTRLHGHAAQHKPDHAGQHPTSESRRSANLGRAQPAVQHRSPLHRSLCSRARQKSRWCAPTGAPCACRSAPSRRGSATPPWSGQSCDARGSCAWRGCRHGSTISGWVALCSGFGFAEGIGGLSAVGEESGECAIEVPLSWLWPLSEPQMDYQ